MKNSSKYMYKVYVNQALSNYSQDKINVFSLSNGKFEIVNDVFKYLIELIYNLSNKSNKYIIKLLIGIKDYLNYYKKIEFNIDKKYIDSINSIREIYNELLKNDNKEPDKNINILITEIEEFIKINYNCEENSKVDDDFIDLNKQIIDKDNEIKKLLRELETYKENVNKLSEKNKRFENIKQNLHKTINDLKEKLEKTEQENQKLLEIKVLLETQNNNHNKLNQTLCNQINELHTENKRLNLLVATINNQIKELKEIIKEYENKERSEIEKDNKEKIIDNFLTNKLLSKTYTINQMLNVLEKNGIECSITEIKEALKRIKQKINIINPYNKTIPVEYTVCSPLITTNANFEIYPREKTYDIIITSDWHLYGRTLKKTVLDKIDNLYNYCVEKHINLIINLGDFLDVNQKDTSNKYNDNMLLLDDILKKFPQEKAINQAILGGNHDRRLLDIGIDPLSYLSNNRDDFINLGYDDAKLIICKNNIVGLHHPNACGLDMLNIIKNEKYILEYLKKFYIMNGIRKSDSYLDLFGHFHISRFDAEKGYFYVPTFIKSNSLNQNGILHLKLFLNENNLIDYLTIKSLVFNDNLVPVNEYVYKKRNNR